MRKFHFIALMVATLFVTSCKVQQVDFSKIYNTCWVNHPENGLDSELKFNNDHTATLTTVSKINGNNTRSVSKYTYTYTSDGRIRLIPADNSAKLYAFIKGDKLELKNNIPDNVIILKKQ